MDMFTSTRVGLIMVDEMKATVIAPLVNDLLLKEGVASSRVPGFVGIDLLLLRLVMQWWWPTFSFVLLM
jgi:hypothetical protein